jgi:hypothetical protein
MGVTLLQWRCAIGTFLPRARLVKKSEHCSWKPCSRDTLLECKELQTPRQSLNGDPLNKFQQLNLELPQGHQQLQQQNQEILKGLQQNLQQQDQKVQQELREIQQLQKIQELQELQQLLEVVELEKLQAEKNSSQINTEAQQLGEIRELPKSDNEPICSKSQQPEQLEQFQKERGTFNCRISETILPLTNQFQELNELQDTQQSHSQEARSSGRINIPNCQQEERIDFSQGKEDKEVLNII